MKLLIHLFLLLPVIAPANSEWIPTDPFTDHPLEALNRENIEEAITAVMPFDFTTSTATEVGGYVGDDLAFGYQELNYRFDEDGGLISIYFAYVIEDPSDDAINNLVEVADYYEPRAMSAGDIGSTFELVTDIETEASLEILILVP